MLLYIKKKKINKIKYIFFFIYLIIYEFTIHVEGGNRYLEVSALFVLYYGLEHDPKAFRCPNSEVSIREGNIFFKISLACEISIFV